MAWWEWLVIGAAVGVFALVSLTWVVRRTLRGRAILRLSFREKLRFGRLLLSDSRTPLPARAALAFLIGYLLLPFDLVPDFVPVVGQLDDLIVLAAVIALLLWLIDGDLLDEAIARSRAETAARTG